ncbi:MAG TPA: hypothetical protein PKJ33_01475 [Alphaproteobacteria bacterium]|nr:hypothetical protein [Alphaproteobacteria bacterium]
MNLRYITCSGIREFTSVEKIINLLKLSDKVEIAFPGDSSIMKYKMPGNEWFSETIDILSCIENADNLAMHIVGDWAVKFCKNGVIDADLYDWFDIKNIKTHKPVIKRWQFDLYGRQENFDPEKVAKIISNYPDREFVFLYHDNLKNKLSRLNNTGVKFSLTYKAQFDWKQPIFNNCPQGYTGKLCAGNIDFNLGRIKNLVPQNHDTWVEAHKLLMDEKTQEFNFHFAEEFIRNVLLWLDKQKAQNK